MRYIIKAVDKPVGASEHFISALVHCKYCAFERMSSYYIFAYLSFWQYRATDK